MFWNLISYFINHWLMLCTVPNGFHAAVWMRLRTQTKNLKTVMMSYKSEQVR